MSEEEKNELEQLQGVGWKPAEPNEVSPDDAGAPIDAPAQSSGHETLEGEVRDFKARTETAGNNFLTYIWTFSLEKFDRHTGNRLPPIAVEMRGTRMMGVPPKDGDTVQVAGKWESGTFQASNIINTKTGADVHPRLMGKERFVIVAVLGAVILSMGILFWVAQHKMQNAQKAAAISMLKAQCQGSLQQWQFENQHMGTDDQAIRSQMSAANCASVGISLPPPLSIPPPQPQPTSLFPPQPGAPSPPPAPKIQTAPSQKVVVSSGVMQSNRIGGENPTYPAIAKAARIQGTVVLQATISKSGAIENLRVVSGPPMLQMAAMEAVRGWRYKPYLLNGEPIEVETQVNVVFSLGN
jgi:TonB family protein